MRSSISLKLIINLCIFQPPIVILNVSVKEASGLEAKDADGKYPWICGVFSVRKNTRLLKCRCGAMRNHMEKNRQKW